MLEELDAAAPHAEPDPAGFWHKPYGGLALHRRDNWMVAVKGYSKYVWDYENGEPDENVYGQYLSHGMLTIFARGDPVSDISSGYRLDCGWDWYRMPKRRVASTHGLRCTRTGRRPGQRGIW